ncbi:MAG: hypothetical protein P8M20_07005 [Planctomycetaceae bacterium]|nr:hypothetical protein [Planctomycetaceae bacterium]
MRRSKRPNSSSADGRDRSLALKRGGGLDIHSLIGRGTACNGDRPNAVA